MPWKILITLFLFPALSLAGPESDLGRAAFAVLRAELAQEKPVYSETVLDRLAAETGLSTTEVRTRLFALLDTLEAQRHRKSENWKALIELGGADLPARTADKLLGHLIGRARDMLNGQGNYLLDSGITKAARKVRLYQYQGRDFLLQALDWALARSATTSTGNEIGILVSGHTNRFEVHKDPLFIFFDVDDESFVLEQVREIQRFIIPELVRRLPRSEKIRWVVRQREANALVDPRYELVFGVDNLTFTGSNRDLRPCIEATVELLDGASGDIARTWPLAFCTERYGSATTRELTPFYEEVADEVCKLVDAYLSR